MTSFSSQQRSHRADECGWPDLPTTPQPAVIPPTITWINLKPNRLQQRTSYVIPPYLTLPFYMSDAERSSSHASSKLTHRPAALTLLGGQIINRSHTFPCMAHEFVTPPPAPSVLAETMPAYSPSSRSQRRDPVLLTMKSFFLLGATLILEALFSWCLWNHLFTLVIVSWLLTLILIAHITSRYLQDHFHLGFPQMLTTLRLAALRTSSTHIPSPLGRNPHLANLRDTTAYLKALRQEFLSSLPSKRERTR